VVETGPTGVEIPNAKTETEVAISDLRLGPRTLRLAVFLFAIAVTAVAQFMILRSWLAGRTPGTSDSRGARVREAFWILLPAIGLVVTLLFTWRAVSRPNERAITADPLSLAAMRTTR
jgi:hypothetical protein